MIKQFPYDYVSSALNEWAKDELKKKNLEFDPQVPAYMQLQNHLSRLITNKPRKFSTSNAFHVSSENQKGFSELKKAIEEGKNLNQHLSKLITNARFVDGLFDYYGCVHFHLGDTLIQDKKTGSEFIERTGEIALAIVNDDEVFMIETKQHGSKYPETWTNLSVIEIIHAERPDLIAKNRVSLLQDISPTITDDEDILALRKSGICFAVTVSDGTQYMPSKFGPVVMGLNNKHLNLGAIHLLEMQSKTREIFFQINNLIKNFKLAKKCTLTNVQLYDLQSDNNSVLKHFKVKINYSKNLVSSQYIHQFNWVKS
ncbi:hypothetical protein [Acinetobacter modestus]|uniref:hypothetical protein n=1 Tax=Acinetobacter modestus TaxID=1776740 RepID=UPI00301B2D39